MFIYHQLHRKVVDGVQAEKTDNSFTNENFVFMKGRLHFGSILNNNTEANHAQGNLMQKPRAALRLLLSCSAL